METVLTEEQRERKAVAVQEALKGLDVEYQSHYGKSLTPDMARVKGYSIIWHEIAYSHGNEDTVEVRKPGGDIEAHYPISELRSLIIGSVAAARERLDKALFDYIATTGRDPVEYDYSYINEILNDLEGDA